MERQVPPGPPWRAPEQVLSLLRGRAPGSELPGGVVKRRKPLRARRSPVRRTQIKRARRKPRPDADPDYIEFRHHIDCRDAVYLDTYRFCEGPITAAHVGDRPFGRKCPDAQAIALCYGHGVTDQHWFGRGKDGRRGFFAAMTKEQRRDWYAEQIAACRSLYLESRGAL